MDLDAVILRGLVASIGLVIALKALLWSFRAFGRWAAGVLGRWYDYGAR